MFEINFRKQKRWWHANLITGHWWRKALGYFSPAFCVIKVMDNYQTFTVWKTLWWELHRQRSQTLWARELSFTITGNVQTKHTKYVRLDSCLSYHNSQCCGWDSSADDLIYHFAETKARSLLYKHMHLYKTTILNASYASVWKNC